ncbi:MAG: hypothetical protein ACRDGD_01580 [Candidatus Limnocylindria bacterium]
MTATTSNVGTRRAQGLVAGMRHLALVAGSVLGAIGSRWNAIVEAGQLGPDTARSISRHTGARM